MVQSTRLLVQKMLQENMCYPLHLGVTEAGEGEDGRIRSAVGIGTLLEDGIGDTIRVSLSEAPEHELPVAKILANRYTNRSTHTPIPAISTYQINPFSYKKRESIAYNNIGGDNQTLIGSELPVQAITTCSIDSFTQTMKHCNNSPVILKTNNLHGMAEQRYMINSMIENNIQNPVIINRDYSNLSKEEIIIHASTDFGALLIDGLCDGIQLESAVLSSDETKTLELAILQASGTRISRTEFISCPTCGRTQFNLTNAVADVKTKTAHLKGLKIAVMGCIVNGPGEMADADYGYVGSGAGKVTLFKKQTPVLKNIAEEQALEELIKLIKQHNDWVEPATI